MLKFSFRNGAFATGKEQTGQLFTDFGGLIESILHRFRHF